MPAEITADKNRAWVNPAILIVLAAVTLCLYSPVRTHDFIGLDDVEYVTANPHVKAGLTVDGIRWAFTQNHAANWHPLTWLSHMADCELFGVNAGPHHLVNVGFHVANTLLLYLLLQSLTRARWRSAFVAALFAWHPLHVESVAWVAERKDVLSTFFFLLTLGAYARYARLAGMSGTKSKLFYALALMLFALGLLAKPMLVTLPFVLLLMDVWPLHRAQLNSLRGQITPLTKLVVEKIPFFLLTIVSCGLTLWAQHAGRAIATVDSMPLLARLVNPIASYLRYWDNMFWPDRLAIFYPLEQKLPIALAVSSLLVIIFFSAFAWGNRARCPWLLVGWLWYLGTLVPVIGFVQVGSQAMADRYTYIPLIGLFVIVAWGVTDLTRGWKNRAVILGIVGSTALLACIGKSTRQITYWKDSRTLFAHAAAVTKYNYMAWTFLGAEYSKQNNHAEAIRCFEKAVQFGPKKPHAWMGLAHEQEALGLHEEAQKNHAIAMELDPNNAAVVNTYAISLAEQGKFAEAETQLRRSLELAPDFVEPRLNLVIVLRSQGKLEESLAEAQRVLALDPGSERPHAYLADTLAELNRFQEALPHYREAIRLNPKNTATQIHLAMCLSALKQTSETIAAYRTALRLDENNLLALNNLAWVLATDANPENRNGAEAVTLAKHASQLTKDEAPMVLGTLAAAYAEAGQFDQAIATAEKARDLARWQELNDTAARNEELLKNYQAHRPYHEAGKE